MPEVLLPPSFNLLHRRMEQLSKQVSDLTAMVVSLTAKVDDLKAAPQPVGRTAPVIEQVERGHASPEENLTYPRRRGRPPKVRQPEE